MMWGWDDGWGWGMGWGMLFGGLLPLLLFALFVYLGAQLLGRAGAGGSGSTSAPPPPGRQETPLELAQRRYAAGELSREEFVRIRDDLTGTGAPPIA